MNEKDKSGQRIQRNVLLMKKLLRETFIRNVLASEDLLRNVI